MGAASISGQELPEERISYPQTQKARVPSVGQQALPTREHQEESLGVGEAYDHRKGESSYEEYQHHSPRHAKKGEKDGQLLELMAQRELERKELEGTVRELRERLEADKNKAY